MPPVTVVIYDTVAGIVGRVLMYMYRSANTGNTKMAVAVSVNSVDANCTLNHKSPSFTVFTSVGACTTRVSLPNHVHSSNIIWNKLLECCKTSSSDRKWPTNLLLDYSSTYYKLCRIQQKHLFWHDFHSNFLSLISVDLHKFMASCDVSGMTNYEHQSYLCSNHRLLFAVAVS